MSDQHADYQEKVEHIASQWRQAKGPQPQVTCECGNCIPLRFMFRCLYCGAFFCQSCAEVHFGKTRIQYDAERLLSNTTPQGHDDQPSVEAK